MQPDKSRLIRVLITTCIVVLLGLFVSGLVIRHTNNNNPAFIENSLLQENVVKITSEGFIPSTIVISKDNQVVWKNYDKEYHWPASDIHPTHELYSDFDPEIPIPPDGSWTFTFKLAGTWQYHDHLQPKFRGTIQVK